MALRLHGLRLTAEYRGVQPGGEFTRDGETDPIVYGPKLKFEVEDPESGDVSLVALRGADFDRCEPPFDWQSLKKGDVLDLELTAVLGDGDRERSYVRVRTAQLAGGKLNGKPPVPVAA
jgi:hypothetical protein